MAVNTNTPTISLDIVSDKKNPSDNSEGIYLKSILHKTYSLIIQSKLEKLKCIKKFYRHKSYGHVNKKYGFIGNYAGLALKIEPDGTYRLPIFLTTKDITTIVGFSDKKSLNKTAVQHRISDSYDRYASRFLSLAAQSLYRYILTQTVSRGILKQGSMFGQKAEGSNKEMLSYTSGLNMSKKTWIRALKELKDAGLIQYETDPINGTTVTVLLHGLHKFILNHGGGQRVVREPKNKTRSHSPKIKSRVDLYLDSEDLQKANKKDYKTLVENLHHYDPRWCKNYTGGGGGSGKSTLHINRSDNKQIDQTFKNRSEKVAVTSVPAEIQEDLLENKETNIFLLTGDLPLPPQSPPSPSNSIVTSNELVKAGENKLRSIHTRQAQKASSRLKEEGLSAKTLKPLWDSWVYEVYPGIPVMNWTGKVYAQAKNLLNEVGNTEEERIEFFKFCAQQWQSVKEQHIEFGNEKGKEEDPNYKPFIIPDFPDMGSLCSAKKSFMNGYKRYKFKGFTDEQKAKIRLIKQGYSLEEADNQVRQVMLASNKTIALQSSLELQLRDAERITQRKANQENELYERAFYLKQREKDLERREAEFAALSEKPKEQAVETVIIQAPVIETEDITDYYPKMPELWDNPKLDIPDYENVFNKCLELGKGWASPEFVEMFLSEKQNTVEDAYHYFGNAL